MEHLSLLESLNLYYNKIQDLKEVFRLRKNQNLRDMDLRLNPVTGNEPDYRLFIAHMLPLLRRLGELLQTITATVFLIQKYMYFYAENNSDNITVNSGNEFSFPYFFHHHFYAFSSGYNEIRLIRISSQGPLKSSLFSWS